MTADYSLHVENPRFGKGPRFTGLDPDPESPEVHLHWNTGYRTRAFLAYLKELPEEFRRILSEAPEGLLIPGTAIRADPERQTRATIPVTHYYDLDKTCEDCGRPFVFFAEEQKHWYEVLGFDLAADCVRCHPCRRARRAIGRKKRR